MGGRAPAARRPSLAVRRSLADQLVAPVVEPLQDRHLGDQVRDRRAVIVRGGHEPLVHVKAFLQRRDELIPDNR